MKERFKIIGIPASELVVNGKSWCQVHHGWEDRTKCMKCEEELCQKTFELNQGLCDKCRTHLKLLEAQKEQR